MNNDLVKEWAIPEKNKWGGGGGGGGGLEFLSFLLYPWKFQTKQGFTPRNSIKLCYTPQKF